MQLPTTAQLEQALAIRQQIDALESTLAVMFRSTAPRRISAARPLVTPARASHKKGGLTPEGRRKLSESMKARWAARRKAAGKR
jgi:hypothetical protein